MNGHFVRNLFDQYGQPENRVTHALAQVLARSPRLVRDFVRFAVEVDPPEGSLSLSCQVFPDEQQQGEPLQTLSEEEAEHRGIPDLWIWSEPAKWAIVCECKVGGTPTVEQLRRHAETARRLGFKAARQLVVTADESRPATLPNRINGLPVAWTSWAQLFAFLSHRHRDGHLVAEFLDYLRIAEEQAMAEGRDIPPLTTFTGIPFGRDHPYTELEAKSVLRALMVEVRRRLAAASVLRIEPVIRRPALVGAWDVIGLKDADPARPFNEYPHLNVDIERNHISTSLILPNDAPAEHWRRVRAVDTATLKKVLAEVARRVRPMRHRVGRGAREPQLRLGLSQRHFYARRYATEDGVIWFDLDVLFEVGRTSQVRHVSAWLDALHEVLARTARANFEMALTARYPLLDGSLARKPEFIGAFVRTAEAFQPFVAFLLEGRTRQKAR